MELKLIALIAAVVFGVPFAIFLTTLSKKFLDATFIVLILSLCEPDKTAVMIISRPFYRAITRGLEFSLADMCAIVLCVGMILRSKEFTIRWLPPLSLTYCALILTAIISYTLVPSSLPIPAHCHPITNDYFETNLYPLFEITKIMRGLLLFWVCVTFLSSKDGLKLLGYSLLLSIFYLGLYALKDRYIHGIHRIATTMDHSNVLGTYMIMLSSGTFALAILHKNHLQKILFFAGTALGGLTSILTISRGAIVFWACAICGIALLLIKGCNKVNNVLYAVMGIFLLSAILVKSADSLSERFNRDSQTDYSLREEYNIEALTMAEEHLWGVGLGNYSAFSWHRYAALNPIRREGPGIPAHNIWLLTAAEIGYPGLLLFVLIWLKFYYFSIKNIFRTKEFSQYVWLVVSMVAMTGVLLQESLNNAYRHMSVYFMINIFIAITISINYTLIEQRKASDKI